MQKTVGRRPKLAHGLPDAHKEVELEVDVRCMCGGQPLKLYILHWPRVAVADAATASSGSSGASTASSGSRGAECAEGASASAIGCSCARESMAWFAVERRPLAAGSSSHL